MLHELPIWLKARIEDMGSLRRREKTDSVDMIVEMIKIADCESFVD